MRYIVFASRTNGTMKMGWQTKAEQTSCANQYARQGWRVQIADCETELHERIVDQLYHGQRIPFADERACARISIFPTK